MTEEEKYLFDLRGYLVVDDVLSPAELAILNRLIDENHPGVQEETNKRHAGGFLPWGQAFVNLIDHPRIMPLLKFILGDGFRMDHYYAIYMEKGGTV
ncbi:MAG: mitomycin antibiotics/polyketide fumonisin biosynthesis protein, partial [bacterium]|nr:mitomycin antibiotics/polyketide fumonisin biosynthesis protein [bacterium]